MSKYGGPERKIKTFNEMYQSIYQGDFATLATASYFNGSKKILDMPCINGEEMVFEDNFNIVDDGDQKKLYEFFEKSGFFITDYRIHGNVVRVADEKGNSYFLIRDVDLLGRRNSMDVTPFLLKEELLSSIKGVQNYQDKEEYEKLNAISKGEKVFKHPVEGPTTKADKDFVLLKNSLLEAIKQKLGETDYSHLNAAKNFPEFCDAVCQHTSKPGFFSSEQTKALDLLRTELKKDLYKDLKTSYKLEPKMLNIQIRSIGATSTNFIKNNFAQDKDKLANARSFFKQLYHPEFDAQSRKEAKDLILGNKMQIFNQKSYMQKFKTDLNYIKKEKDQPNPEQFGNKK